MFKMDEWVSLAAKVHHITNDPLADSMWVKDTAEAKVVTSHVINTEKVKYCECSL